MEQIRDMEIGSNEKNNISLQEFCDMDQLYRILDNWSKSSGMATVIIDTEGNQVSEDFGMTEFCISRFRLYCRMDRCLARCWQDRRCLRYRQTKKFCKKQQSLNLTKSKSKKCFPASAGKPRKKCRVPMTS